MHAHTQHLHHDILVHECGGCRYAALHLLRRAVSERPDYISHAEHGRLQDEGGGGSLHAHTLHLHHGTLGRELVATSLQRCMGRQHLSTWTMFGTLIRTHASSGWHRLRTHADQVLHVTSDMGVTAKCLQRRMCSYLTLFVTLTHTCRLKAAGAVLMAKVSSGEMAYFDV